MAAAGDQKPQLEQQTGDTVLPGSHVHTNHRHKGVPASCSQSLMIMNIYAVPDQGAVFGEKAGDTCPDQLPQ